MYGYKYASLLFLISEADCCTKNKKTSGYVNNMILIFAYSDVPRKQIVDIADSLGGSIVGEIPEIYQYQIQVGFTECIIVNASYFYISKEFVRDNIHIEILTELLSLGELVDSDANKVTNVFSTLF